MLKVLQLLTYTAAETDAQQFIEMIFSTSVGQFVFNSYKDRKPLPEDVARANGHEDLAHYLEDVNSRYVDSVQSTPPPPCPPKLTILLPTSNVLCDSKATCEGT